MASPAATGNAGQVTADCRLCSIGEREAPLAEHRIGVAVPSVGSLVEGWLLVIPHRHILSIVDLSGQERDEFSELVGAAYAMTTSEYGPAALFEHGPSAARRKVGCGVDHAHMHVVPLPAVLRSEIEALDIAPTTLMWRPADSVWDAEEEHRAGLDYLYVREADGAQWIASTADGPSQLFRRAIAHAIGEPVWDWKADARSEISAATRLRLSA